MKRFIVILTLGFLLSFAGNSQARGYYRSGYHGGYAHYGYCGHRGYYYAPRPYVVYHPYYYDHVWVPGFWGWNRWNQWVWFNGYWR
ncbi:MAG TPA: hypothetical protein VK890_13315 [Bacteroidia bacterium]|nr:hypothetical protein [Bacteroidia bacterium]